MSKRTKITLISLSLIVVLLFGGIVSTDISTETPNYDVSDVQPPANTEPSVPRDPSAPPAIKTDMCGESLIGQALPHIAYPGFAQLVIDRTKTPHSVFDKVVTDGIPVPTPGEPNDVVEYILTHYQYLLRDISYSYPLLNGSDVFLVCATQEHIDKANAVYAEAERIIEFLDIDETVTQEEAIIRINAYICENKSYEYDEEKVDRSTYNSMFGNTGVCHNYAIQFQILCLTAGIECHYVVNENASHAWNEVYFSDGTYRLVDVTWNDGRSQNEAGEWVETSTSNGFDALYVFERRQVCLLITEERAAVIDEASGAPGEHLKRQYDFLP